MKKSYIIETADRDQFLKYISKAMTQCKTFYNVSEKPANDHQTKITIG